MDKLITNRIIRTGYLFFLTLFLSVSSCNQMEDCYKEYFFTGIVKDGAGTAIQGVEVYFVDPSTGNISPTFLTTDASGHYEQLGGQTRGSMVGVVLKFVKTGYTTVLSSPVTSDEGGASTCGYREIKRDATLVP